MSFVEHPLLFECTGERLLGIVARPITPCSTGVLIVVGGPQYRVGSHRQFVLLSRYLADLGIPSLRFDHRGIGDSSGAIRSFETIGDDIGAAISAFQEACPEITSVVLWGLCDAASAAMIQAPLDDRIAGLVLLNPWARTEATLAETHLRHYYASRLRDPRFWKGLVQGSVGVGSALRSFSADVAASVRGRFAKRPGHGVVPFRSRMLWGMEHFRGPVLLILSGRDLTAKEFVDQCGASSRWRDVLSRPSLKRYEMSEADHTFSTAIWRLEVAHATWRFFHQHFAREHVKKGAAAPLRLGANKT